jgi:ribosomal protein L7/L12
MQITIQVTSHKNTAQATITTTTVDPAKEGSKALLRLVRLVEKQERTNSYRILVTGMENKIQLIKLVRMKTGLGLKEAKELVESGKPLVKGLPADKVPEWTQGLDEVKATYEVQAG